MELTSKDLKVITTRVPPSLHKQLADIAHTFGYSLSTLVLILLEHDAREKVIPTILKSAIDAKSHARRDEGRESEHSGVRP